MWTSRDFDRARAGALSDLMQANRYFAQAVRPRLTLEQQQAVYRRISADPILFDRVLAQYGRRAVENWQRAMLGGQKEPSNG